MTKFLVDIFFTVLLCEIISINLVQPVQAYLDPGTGSLIIQLTIGFIVAALATLKKYWNQVKSFFKNRKS